tara:strand:+ start:317 stop:1012 length:696 start_codon:yes stop_codon:yes gene_type:complete
MKNLQKKTKFNIKQLMAIEKMATTPGYSSEQLSKDLDMAVSTIRKWKNDINFINAVYDRFMDIGGKYMPDVIMAQVREAMEGNTQAATLVLKHFGKFEDKLTIKIEAPFSQFLKSSTIEDAEIVKEDAIEIGNSFVLPKKEIPKRNVENNNPTYRKKKQTQKLKKVYKHRKHLNNRNERYKWLTRAKAVGVDPLPKGRPTKEKLRNWHNDIIKAEQKFANGIVSKEQKNPK